MQMDHLISTRKQDLMLAKKKKQKKPETTTTTKKTKGKLKLADFAVAVDQSGNQNSKKINKYLDLVKELKKMRRMSMTMIPTVVVVLETAPKNLVRRQEKLKFRGRFETI